jgi:hypothetical protein
MPTPVFDPAKQQGRFISEYCGAGVKDGMSGIWPVGCRQYRVLVITMKERFEAV